MPELITGGSCTFVEQNGVQLPVFAFGATDPVVLARTLRGMFVQFDVRFTTSRRLAYHMDVPDRNLGPWVVTVDPELLPRVVKGVQTLNTCITVIQVKGQAPDLKVFTEDLEHDWSGRYAEGLEAFMGDDLETARQKLGPLAAENPKGLPAVHHLLGRCHRAANELDQAVTCYIAGAQAATHSLDDAFLPHAAGILSDMGVAFKKMGELQRASQCLQRSLCLRPNHPNALATFATLFGGWRDGIVYCLARIVAIGGWDPLVQQLALSAGAALGQSSVALLEEAQAIAPLIEITSWPLADGALAPKEFFAKLLQDVPGEPTPPALILPKPLAPQPARPWWRFW